MRRKYRTLIRHKHKQATRKVSAKELANTKCQKYVVVVKGWPIKWPSNGGQKTGGSQNRNRSKNARIDKCLSKAA